MQCFPEGPTYKCTKSVICGEMCQPRRSAPGQVSSHSDASFCEHISGTGSTISSMTDEIKKSSNAEPREPNRFCLPSHRQALAGPGLPDHLHHRQARHAEAARGLLALSAQLPPGHDLLLRGPGARPAAAESPLPPKPHAGGERRRGVSQRHICT